MSMKKQAYVVTSSVLGTSKSSELAHYAKECLEQEGWEVIVEDVSAQPLPPVNATVLGEFADKQSMGASKVQADRIIKNLKESQLLVIATPLYNFTIPAQLKVWLDYSCRAGETFAYTAEGPKGLLGHAKALVIRAAGGDYSSEHMAPLDHAVSYLKTVLGFMGVHVLPPVKVEGTALGSVEEQMQQHKRAIAEQIAVLSKE